MKPAARDPLQEKAGEAATRLAPSEAEEIASVPVIEVPGSWETILDGAARQNLEQTVLPSFLRAQRWFGGKARRIESVRLADQGRMPGGNNPIFLTLFEVKFTDGTADLYFVPLAVTPGQVAGRVLQTMRKHVVARLTGPAGNALLHDALADNDFCTALLWAIGSEQEVATQAGSIHGFPTAAYRELRGGNDPLAVALGPPTSSNSLVFYGRRLLMKLFRRLEVGINPDFEIGRFLTEKTRFDRIPKVAGTIEYHRPGSGPISLSILQAVVRNRGDGWSHAIEELGRYFDRASSRVHGPDPLTPNDRPLKELADADRPPAALETVGDYLQAATTLGRRTAELHLALASNPNDPAFAPEPLTEADLAGLTDEIVHQGRQALAGLRDTVDSLPQDITAEGKKLLEEAPARLLRFARTPGFRPGTTTKIRCHGDYHLGQVLLAENDFVILDFEGEPTRTVEARRARQSPLKDVAGMLRSFDYAAYAGLFAFTKSRPDDFGRLEPWAALWQQGTSAAFLSEYRRTADDAAFLPADPAQFAALLDGFALAKAFYELLYELNNRPDWVRIPLRGILSLLDR